MAQSGLRPGIGPLRDAMIGRRSLLFLTGAVGAGAVLAACAKPRSTDGLI
jgi:D-alanyl-D-alanine carboxypeptidase